MKACANSAIGHFCDLSCDVCIVCEYMDEISTQQIAGEAKLFSLCDKACGEIIGQSSFLRLIQRSQENPDGFICQKTAANQQFV